jgi:two-component system phosphate regulon response regulator OmpR
MTIGAFEACYRVSCCRRAIGSTTAESAAEARAKLEGLHFDLMILDVMMPGESGFEFARDLRTRSSVPILMLTARGEAESRIEGLECGADDYVGKPFEPRELSLRIGNILKRAGRHRRRARVGTLWRIRLQPRPRRPQTRRRGDPSHRSRARDDAAARDCAGETVTRLDLAGGNGNGNSIGERAVDVQINRLRRKIERDPTNPLFIQTARGIGYRLVTTP